jgi:hypothetical protein
VPHPNAVSRQCCEPTRSHSRGSLVSSQFSFYIAHPGPLQVLAQISPSEAYGKTLLIRVHAHTPPFAHSHTHVYTPVHTSAHAFIYIHTHTYSYTHMDTHPHIYLMMKQPIYMITHTYPSAHTHPHINAHTHTILTHAPSLPSPPYLLYFFLSL